MALARYNGSVQRLTGAAYPNAQVWVYREGEAGIANLFSDRNGSIPKDNPILTSEDGSFFFHAPGGAYRFEIISQAGTKPIRYVPVGLGAESDVTGLTPRGLWVIDTTYEIGDLVTILSGGQYLMFASRLDDNLNHAPDSATPADNTWWQYLGHAVQLVSTGAYVGLGDETAPLIAGTGKVTLRNFGAWKIAGIRAHLTTASTAGPVVVDINVNGASILSTKLTIDQGEKTSVTAAVPVVISDDTVDDDSEITFDIDNAGANAVGLKVVIATLAQ